MSCCAQIHLVAPMLLEPGIAAFKHREVTGMPACRREFDDHPRRRGSSKRPSERGAR